MYELAAMARLGLDEGLCSPLCLGAHPCLIAPLHSGQEHDVLALCLNLSMPFVLCGSSLTYNVRGSQELRSFLLWVANNSICSVHLCDHKLPYGLCAVFFFFL